MGEAGREVQGRGTDALFGGYWEAGQYGDLLGVTQASSPG